MTAALKGGEWSAARPSRTSPPGKDPVPILQEAGWAPGPVWTGRKSRPHWASILDPPARTQLLYWLSYPAHTHIYYMGYFTCYRVMGCGEGILNPKSNFSTQSYITSVLYYFTRREGRNIYRHHSALTRWSEELASHINRIIGWGTV